MPDHQPTDVPKRPRGLNLRKRERTRSKLINSARQLLLNKSADEITIQEITVNADVALGTFYNYFVSKTAMMSAVADDLISSAVNEVVEEIDQVSVVEPKARLRIAFDLLRDKIISHDTLGFLLLEAGLPLQNFINGIEQLVNRSLGQLKLAIDQRTILSGSAANLLIKHYSGHLRGSSAELLVSLIEAFEAREGAHQ